jgi:starch synthase
MMKVLFTSAEADPFAKVGGLADVVGSLPRALRTEGVDARVIMPFYRTIDPNRFGIKHLFRFQLARPIGTTDVDIFATIYKDVPFYFVKGYPFFGEENAVYSQRDWDIPRFIFFSQACIAAADAMRHQINWFPDVIHTHDWHTGLVPFLISHRRRSGEPHWARTGAVTTIHNMAYQGDHAGGWLFELGIPGREEHSELSARDLTDNLLAMSLAYSDLITTVSPRYAIEIQYPYMGFGLDGLLRTRVNDMRGILNGIDMNEWNPETDSNLVAPFNADNFVEKRGANKRQLQIDCGLEVRPDLPLIGMVTRLVWQKGIDLAIPALRWLLAGANCQFVLLGSGEQDYEVQFSRLGSDFGWKARTFIGYNAAVAQRVYAGSDMFLMPSHYEPCGVGQMIAMRYGALPVVRETGGLADTVPNYDDADGERGTGFVFSWEEPEAILNTLRWGITTFNDRPDAWRRMQERAMRTDLSWNKSARDYIAVYDDAAARHKP